MSTLDEDEEEQGDSDPPEATRVAARCGVLVALAYRSHLEKSYADRPRAVRQAHESLVDWTRTPAIAAEEEPAEQDSVRRPVGALSPRERVDLSWLTEGAVVLAWALNLTDLPSYDTQSSGEVVANAIDFLASPWLLPETACRRDEDAIEERWGAAIALHWRLRQQKLRPGPMDFEDFVTKCNWAPLSTRGLRLRDRDLLVGEVPVSSAPADAFQDCLSITQERHRAFEWLIGGERLWSEVTTDT